MQLVKDDSSLSFCFWGLASMFFLSVTMMTWDFLVQTVTLFSSYHYFFVHCDNYFLRFVSSSSPWMSLYNILLISSKCECHKVRLDFGFAGLRCEYRIWAFGLGCSSLGSHQIQ